jgi:hypothetical protein
MKIKHYKDDWFSYEGILCIFYVDVIYHRHTVFPDDLDKTTSVDCIPSMLEEILASEAYSIYSRKKQFHKELRELLYED